MTRAPTKATVYHYAKCSTCRCALAWLRSRGVDVETIDIVTAPPNARELARIAKLAEREPAKMFNTSGESYRAGGFKDRVASMKAADVFAALAADGKLIKRPLVVADGFALVGFDEQAYAARWPHAVRRPG